MKLFKKKKSWWLSNAQTIADASPYTFYKPSSEAVARLTPGDEVKLIFQFNSDDPEAPNAERMWVEIRKIGRGKFEGILDNDPVWIKNLECGDSIAFKEEHIIQVSIEDPVPADTDKYLARCFVTNRVLYEGAAIEYLYREQPDYEDDSGWRIMAGDETSDYMDDPENISYVSLGAVLARDDCFVSLIEKPIGSSFKRDASTDSFIEVS